MRQLSKKALLVAFTLLMVAASPLSSLAEPPRVGLILPLTGGLSEYGVAFRNGVELALEQDKEISKKVRFSFEDSQYDSKRAIAAFEKLTTSDKANLAFVWGSGPSEAVAPLAEKRAFPLITLGEHDAAVGRAHVVTFTNPSTQFSQAVASYLRTQGYKRIALVVTQIAYFETLSKTFRDNLAPDQSLSIVGKFLPTDSDFKSVIAKISKEKPDALGIYLLNGQVSTFYRQMEEQRVKLPTFGTDIFESSSEIKASEPGIEGAVYAHNLVDDNFRQSYLSKFHNDAQLTTAARGYDLVNLIASNVDAATSDPGNAIFARLTKITSPQQGAGGTYKFEDSSVFGKHFEFPIAVKKIVKGNPTMVSQQK